MNLFKQQKHNQIDTERTIQQQQFRKLCQLCSPNFDKADILASDIDWPVVWKLALRHRVVPVMADRIKQLNIIVPDEFAQLIADNVQQNLYKGMKQAAELVRLTQLFEEHNIPFVVFKGIALLKLMGLELHQRHHGDIDILLADVGDLWKADAALLSIGYQRQTLSKDFTLNEPQKKHFQRYEKDVSYYHPQQLIQLELHFKLCLSRKLLPISVEDFHKNRSEIQINTTTIPVMSQSHHQIYLLVHGAVSRWFRLKWLCDIPLTSNNGYDYLSPDFYSDIKNLNIERMVTLGVFLANELLSMPMMDNLLQYRNTNKHAQRNIYIVRQHMAQQEYNNMSLAEKMYFWLMFSVVYMPSLKKGVSYKTDHFRSYFTRVSDWEVCPLPSTLFFLYYPLRPFLWLKRQF